VARQTAYKWLARFDREGDGGLEDRSCRPHRLRQPTARQVLPAESARYATAFFQRALRWFDRLGVRCQRVLTDNAKCYAESKTFQALCAAPDGPAQSRPSPICLGPTASAPDTAWRPRSRWRTRRWCGRSRTSRRRRR
jgi:hypothetical protein